MVFHPSDPTAYFHSYDPRPVRLIHGEHWLEDVIFGAQTRMTRVTPRMFTELLASMQSILADEIPEWRHTYNELFARFERHELKGLAAYVAYLSRTYFDAQFILISPWERTRQSE